MSGLNGQQRQAVQTVEGPVLLLAGAGSGKTRALTFRIAHLIEDLDVNPWNIMAITFTNKAAREMRERVDRIVGYGSESIWVATFHSSCVRILRRYIDRIGYDTNFTIYDTDDSKSVMKDVCKRLDIDTKKVSEKRILNAISAAKDELRDWDDLRKESYDPVSRKIADAYEEYQKTLRRNNALDFDDLIVETIHLLKDSPEVLKNYQDRFKYVMVDEYQDTNTAQFELIRLLASGSNNLCVVGDDDQSIYKFRGANIYNILNFEKHYPDATVIRMEQNYRSTGNILAAAGGVIAHNKGRKGKKLWTEREKGSLVHLRRAENAQDEAEIIVSDIRRRIREEGLTYRDCAVLYRTNAQSRVIEECFVRSNLPYTLVGGTNFYSRKEIKDILAYLKTVANGTDDVATKRIINVPKRGIGATSVQRVEDYAAAEGISFFEACSVADHIPGMGKAGDKVHDFALRIRVLRTKLGYVSIRELIEEILDSTGYIKELEADNDMESRERIDNLDEFINKAADYDENHEENDLTDFLAEVALVADIDKVEGDDNRAVLMTIHAAKGLEFKNVYMAGMEDGLFPSSMSMDDPEELEEERRLAYVGMTRAMDDLTLLYARSRMVRGSMENFPPSRFLKEVPAECMDDKLSVKKSMDFESYDDEDRRSFREKPYGGTYSAGYGSAGYSGMSSGADRRPKAILRSKATPEYAKPYITQGMAGLKAGAPDGGKPDYEVGDRVRHIKFGEGTVTAMEAGGQDYKVTVDFDGSGTRIMYAAFARLVKI